MSRLRVAIAATSLLALAACSSGSSGTASSSAAASSSSAAPSSSSAAPSSSSAAPTESATVRIGVEGPLTGDQSVTGTGMVNGAKLAADAINARGGLNGKQIEIVPIDDAADPTTGVTAATAAVAAGLDGVVGPYNSGVGVKTLPIYQQAGLVPIRLTSNSSTNGMGYTLQPMDYEIAPVEATGLTQWLKAKSVAIIYDSSQNYTTSVAGDIKSLLEKAGVTVPVYEPITPGAKTYADQVKKAAAANPDVIFAATYFPEGGLIAQAMDEQKVSARCVADYASDDPGFITTAGQAAAAKCAVGGVPAPSDFPKGPAFVADYTTAFGEAPGTWSPYTFDSLALLVEAASASGGFDSAKLTTYLNGVKDWQGVTGAVTIDPSNGNRTPATVVFLQVNDKGEFHVNKEWAAAVGAAY